MLDKPISDEPPPDDFSRYKEEGVEWIINHLRPLRPWKYPDSEVAAKVRKSIDELCEAHRLLSSPIEAGYLLEILLEVFVDLYDTEPPEEREYFVPELRRLLVKFAARLKQAGGSDYLNHEKRLDADPFRDLQKRAATTAVNLITDVAPAKRFGAGSHESPLCQIASILFQIGTGRDEARNLDRACKAALREARALGRI